MSGTNTPEQPIESVDDLVAFLRAGEKPPEDWRVGTEHEKIGLHGADRSPIDYAGDRGIGKLLERIADRAGWEPISEDGNIIALQLDGASITLEPGGQLELSGAPLRTIFETCAEFHAHLELVRAVSEPLDIVWLGLGIHPIHSVEELPRMPKERYRIMRRYLPTRGSRGLIMMFTTATVQANLDYESEADMVDKVRTSLAISPIVSAIFANSSLSDGKANGFVSRRMHAWTDTDPDRCGMLPIAFESDFGYRRYVDWALDVPMFFVEREGRFESAHDMTFRQFLENGRGGERATLADFDRHLTTLFPEVRVKQFIEVRCADAVPPGLTCSMPALWKGILYDATARTAAANLVDANQAEREAASEAVSRQGLAAHYAGQPVLDLARELVGIARSGLERIGHAGPNAPDESAFLDPVIAQLALGKSPGQVVLDCWEGEWERSFERLIEYARY
ncbi:MAG: glutamate--cysteine ligase [Deltaproteobacteria bacterium]|nr:glutamate--cysteine ligase [Deltaproteobacteria bacterium]MBW2691545.1 glutamate--cysteine ligase [Deltaproteobacteria bacterium]